MADSIPWSHFAERYALFINYTNEGRVVLWETDGRLASVNDVEAIAKTGYQSSSVSNNVYVVQKGDNLWKIAQKYLGNGDRWNEIYEANKAVIKDSSLIRIGQQLVIP